MSRLYGFLAVFAMALIGCAAETAVSPDPNITIEQAKLSRADCTDQFVAHDLEHVTTVFSEPVTMFDSNGAGVGVNDLDNDGDLDMVLANLRGDTAVFWNESDLNFRKEPLTNGDTRAVQIVDVDGDGWQDITLSGLAGSVRYWRNDGTGQFTSVSLPNVLKPAYAMMWGDLDEDGDLDLVTGSYDMALEKAFGNSFLFGGGAGVFVYENQDGRFESTRLADNAQALALLVHDLDRDGRLDLLIGNDFAIQDQAWRQLADGGWQLVVPFNETTHSTMSFDTGDINNDGELELFATDMKPYATDATTLAQWQPVMDGMMHHEMEGDPQIMENMLQIVMDGRYQNQATANGLGATGWSWSTKFGDLDNDGFVDAYVVNGMIAQELFSHLPGNELVEENQAFGNDGSGRFQPMPAWGLGSTRSGRGMSMADLDGDGDLDIVVNNLTTPAQLFENQLCGGAALEIDLRWLGSGNTRALGATIMLVTEDGFYTRQIKAGSGYLSGDPSRVHFGIPDRTQLNHLQIVWPDGLVSTVNNVSANTLLKIERPSSV